MSFLDPIKNIFLGKHRGNAVGIDIGESSIKVVELGKEGERVLLRNYGEISLGSRAGVSAGQATNLPPEKIAEALRELLHEMGLSPRFIEFAIPFKASLLSVVELPDVSKRELQSMVPLEARRYIPVPITEVSLDWWVLPKRTSGKSLPTANTNAESGSLGKIEVIIAAINNDVLKKYEVIKKEAHLAEASTYFEVEIFSTMRAVVGRDLAPVAIIDIGAGMTKLAIIEGGVVRGSHLISMGGQDITTALSKSFSISFNDAEKIKCRTGMAGDEEGRDVAAVGELVLMNITGESLRFIENYEHKYGTKITKVILVGGGAQLKGIDKIMAQKFSGIPVVIGDPFSRVGTPAFLAPTLKELSSEFAVAVGVALKEMEG